MYNVSCLGFIVIFSLASDVSVSYGVELQNFATKGPK